MNCWRRWIAIIFKMTLLVLAVETHEDDWSFTDQLQTRNDTLPQHKPSYYYKKTASLVHIACSRRQGNQKQPTVTETSRARWIEEGHTYRWRESGHQAYKANNGRIDRSNRIHYWPLTACRKCQVIWKTSNHMDYTRNPGCKPETALFFLFSLSGRCGVRQTT